MAARARQLHACVSSIFVRSCSCNTTACYIAHTCRLPPALTRPPPHQDIVNALEAARAATHVIVAACTVSGEGHDRTLPSKDHTRTDSVGLALPLEEDLLIEALADVSKNMVVVVTHPGAILLPWAHRVAAIVCMTLPGQEAGNAAADVLFGGVNPSGRFPVSMPFTDNDMNMTQEQVAAAAARCCGGCC